MVFSSISFLIYFLPISLGLYYMAPTRMKNFVLLVESLFFYAWGEPIYVLLMIFSILFNYAFGVLLAKTNDDSSISKGTLAVVENKKLILVVNIIGNLALLGFFKYADFVVHNINALAHLNLPLLNLPLPVGISFYTFQAMSYIIDLYRGKVQVQKNVIAFGTYVALFPQLIAGPIVRFESIEQQLRHREVTMEKFASGVRCFIIGLSKKVLLANNIGILWTSVSNLNAGEVSVLTAWLGAIAFTMQIYYDFSGYSDMAIGLGRMFGFEFRMNFNYPYRSKSITEFWSRWHISLSTWFKEYVYIPLGGNRKGLLRQLINIFLVWMLTGLWHGASWNFVAWGVYFAVLLILEKTFLLKFLNRFPGIVGHFYTMFFVIISWVIFSNDDLSKGLHYIQSMFGLNSAVAFDGRSLYLLANYFPLIVLLAVCATPVPKMVFLKIKNKCGPNAGAVLLIEDLAGLLLFLASIAYIVSSTYNPFLYFRF
ncbi:MBOAT family O-acyltransferase [Clostridium aminobutyricum]|uniref:MBOAT family protein n=1 Tax=Clostridium aminobutyricum TaxID=33953 RepID=A0A939DB12_CLOAM|nr:MBOAT family protein [Clostridium aminobutyricum]MBN7774541.1 MBOAT family protein [Clostridium aminobutyricum]